MVFSRSESMSPPIQFIDRLLKSDRTEILESEDFTLEQRYRIVDQLGEVLRKSGYNREFLKLFEKLVSPILPLPENRPLKICDIGPGSGTIIRSLHDWSRRFCQPIELHGIDIDGDFAALTQSKLRAEGILATISQGDATDLSHIQNSSFDIVISNHMAHHIRSKEKIAQFFKEVDRISKSGYLIIDLERRLRGVPLMALGPLLGGSRLLMVDGIRSIRRAYYRNEIQEILNQNAITSGGIAAKVAHCPYLPYWWVCVSKT